MPLFYKDFDMDMQRNPFSKDIITKVDVKAVTQALKVIILTNKGEKPFNPDFGCGIQGLLFENLSMGTKATIETVIKEQCFTYEPRAVIEKVEFDETPIDSNEVVINIWFHVVGVQELQALNVTFSRIK